MTRVLVAGGGVGGLEATLALRAHGLDVDLMTLQRRFTYRPWSVVEPFGGPPPVTIDVARLADERGVTLIEDRLLAVDPARRQVRTPAGLRDYDVLLLALGARPVPAVPGALTFRDGRDAQAVHGALAELDGTPGVRVGFVIPSGSTWPLPAYELAFLTRRWAINQGADVRIALHTAERSPLAAFGTETSADVARLLAEAQIDVRTGPRPETADADLVVALPLLVGPAVAGLPNDADGFVDVDLHGRVTGVDGVYAVGDMTSGPLKQGGLAAQQADAAAAAIAAASGQPVPAEPYEPVLRALLVTTEGPRYLRHPAGGTEVRPDAGFEAPWWPAHKVAGAHLGPYLATHADVLS